MRHVVPHRNDHFIPVLGFVALEIFVRSREEIIAALELGLAKEDPAVRVGSGAEFEFEDEIFGKRFGGPERCDLAAFGRSRHDQASVLRYVAAIAARGFTIEVVGLIAPAGEVAPIEEADKAL